MYLSHLQYSRRPTVYGSQVPSLGIVSVDVSIVLPQLDSIDFRFRRPGYRLLRTERPYGILLPVGLSGESWGIYEGAMALSCESMEQHKTRELTHSHVLADYV